MANKEEMTKEQAKQILKNVIGQLTLKKADYDTLDRAIETLAAPAVKEVPRAAKEEAQK